jgi:Na+/melibiose symporter-like transporter
MLLVVVYAYLVFKFFPETPFAAELSEWTYVIIAAFPIFATFIGGLVSYGTTAEDPSLLQEEDDVPPGSNCIKIGQLSRIQPFVLVVFMYTFAQLVNSVAQSLLPLYVVHVVGFELEYFSLLLIVQMAMMVTTVIVVSKISKKFEKRTFFNAGCFVYAMVAVAYFFIPSAGTTQDWARYMIYPIAGFAGIAQALTFTMPNAMMADVTDYAHLKLHDKSEGLMFSVMETSQSIVQAVGAWVVGFVLDLQGYVSGETQSDEVKLLIRCLFCFITLGAMTFCWLLSFGYTLNRKKHRELLAKLGAQHPSSYHDMYVSTPSARPQIPDVAVLTAAEPEPQPGAVL